MNKPESTAAAAAPPPTTQQQAVEYMSNEILWAQIIVLAWQDAAVYDRLQKNAENANQTVLDIWAEHFKKDENAQPPVIPDGVTLKIAFDTPTAVHLLMPSVTYIPPGPLDMVPHSL